MGILVNFVDRFFKRLQNGVSESFLEKAENSELHPDVIASMKRVQDDQDRLNEVINKWDLTKPKVKEVSIESKIKYKERKEVIKQIKSLFEQYFIEINEKKIEETEIIEYLKNKHNKSDLFCEEFLESYKDRIEYLIYEKELQEKKSERHKTNEIKTEFETKYEKYTDALYGKIGFNDYNKIKEFIINNFSESDEFCHAFVEKRRKIYDNMELDYKKKILSEKFGKTNVAKILKGDLWVGMSLEMLIEIKGDPDEIIENVIKQKLISKFYYEKSTNRLGNDSFDFEVTITNGLVTGWKDRRTKGTRTI